MIEGQNNASARLISYLIKRFNQYKHSWQAQAIGDAVLMADHFVQGSQVNNRHVSCYWHSLAEQKEYSDNNDMLIETHEIQFNWLEVVSDCR